MHRKLIEALAVDDLGWQDYANCRGADADLFFPERGASTRKAKGICAACQVQVDCLEFAVTKSEKFGIWGGPIRTGAPKDSKGSRPGDSPDRGQLTGVCRPQIRDVVGSTCSATDVLTGIRVTTVCVARMRVADAHTVVSTRWMWVRTVER